MKKAGEVDFLETGLFPKLFCDYLNQKKGLKGFFGHFPDLGNFEKKLNERSGFGIDRKLLVRDLEEQYDGLECSDELSANLRSLSSENTFTVVTGHQLNLLSGPLFFHYKIQTVIRICEDLKKKYGGYNFVPVFWMASEDHDFEEIDHTYIGGEKIHWSTKQKGPVGRFNTEGLQELIVGAGFDSGVVTRFYKGKTLAQATRSLVNHWYGEKGLVIMDGDRKALKESFSPTLRHELEDSLLYSLINNTNEKLEALHYKSQVHARNINLFFLEDGYRERIERFEKDGFKTVDGKHSWKKEELFKVLQSSPEKFSPNVVLRPLYQEHLLPNLAYVGGPAEISYWLQLKDCFQKADISFPILFPRLSAMLLEEKHLEWWHKADLKIDDLFLNKRELELNWVKHKYGDQFSLVSEFQKLEELEGHLMQQARKVDTTLIKYVGARSREMEKELERISKKLRKALERKNRENLNRIGKVKDFSFPGGSVQERKQNYLNFFSEDLGALKDFGEICDPWSFTFKLLTL